MSYIAIIVMLAVVVCLLVGIYLIATSRRTVAAGPRCGHCGYNLTGSTANRCPECGRLFIEAGIVTTPITSLRKRRLIGIVLILAPLIPTTFGFATTMYYRAQAARRAAAAQKAKVAALQKAAATIRLLHQSFLSPTSSPALPEPRRSISEPRP